jgi:hypothetical protein
MQLTAFRQGNEWFRSPFPALLPDPVTHQLRRLHGHLRHSILLADPVRFHLLLQRCLPRAPRRIGTVKGRGGKRLGTCRLSPRSASGLPEPSRRTFPDVLPHPLPHPAYCNHVEVIAPTRLNVL